MNKIFVSLIAVLVTVSAAVADCPLKNNGCKTPKKKRIIYITAPEPEMYGEPMFSDMVLPADSCLGGTCAVEEEPVAVVDLPKPNLEPTIAYIGARVGVHMPTWKNKYHATPSTAIADADADHDTYIFEPIFGGGIFAGRHFGPAWRGDVEFGYISEFSDSDNGFTFKISTPYLMANAYYDFLGGFYLGGGIGFAFPKATLDWQWFTANSASETRLSPIGGLSMGFARALADDMVLDIRYRIAGFYGPKWKRDVKQPDYQNSGGNDLESLETRVGFVLDNSISVGVRYEF